MGKHGKSKKGARFNKKKIAKDIKLRTTRVVPERLLVIFDQEQRDPKALWYWRRGQETWRSIEKKRGG